MWANQSKLGDFDVRLREKASLTARGAEPLAPTVVPSNQHVHNIPSADREVVLLGGRVVVQRSVEQRNLSLHDVGVKMVCIIHGFVKNINQVLYIAFPPTTAIPDGTIAKLQHSVTIAMGRVGSSRKTKTKTREEIG